MGTAFFEEVIFYINFQLFCTIYISKLKVFEKP